MLSEAKEDLFHEIQSDMKDRQHGTAPAGRVPCGSCVVQVFAIPFFKESSESASAPPQSPSLSPAGISAPDCPLSSPCYSSPFR